MSAERAGVELSADPGFAGRIRRLAGTSVVALGLIWLLAARRLDAHPAVGVALASGWLLMPVVLWSSLRRPRLRYGLIVPSALVSLALLAVGATALPADPLARAGWLTLTAGILVGGVLGGWFWYRWRPVPAALDDPFAPGRWLLVAAHVGLVCAGLLMIGGRRPRVNVPLAGIAAGLVRGPRARSFYGCRAPAIPVGFVNLHDAPRSWPPHAGVAT